jgi:hypothetical protein
VKSQPVSWWSQLRLLLDAERRRAEGRKRKAFEKRKSGLKLVGFGWSILFGALIQAMIAGVFLWLAHIAVIVSVERTGHLVVSDQTWELMQRLPRQGDAVARQVPEVAASDADYDAVSDRFEIEARHRREDRGGTGNQWLQVLADRFRRHGIDGFAPESAAGNAGHEDLIYEVLALALGLWWLSLVFQGETGNLDSMRRRHPMWEWYLALPISQTAVFVGEALAPAIGNTFLLTSPVALAVIVGWLQGSVLLGLSMLPVALPLMLAATLWA